MSRELTYAEALREAMDLALAQDERVFLVGEDIGIYGGAFGVTDGLFEKYGSERVRDTPISEAVIAGVATGAALTGMRPVAEIQFMDFITLSMEQLVLQAAKLALHARRKGDRSFCAAHTCRRRHRRGGPTFRKPGKLVCSRAWPQGRHAEYPGRCQGPAAGRDRGSQPGHISSNTSYCTEPRVMCPKDT